jgi:hypothetical protein
MPKVLVRLMKKTSQLSLNILPLRYQKLSYQVHRRGLIQVLSKFSKYHNNMPCKDLTRSNIIALLESRHKTEAQSPMHKWIGSFYNLFRINLLRFCKWLYYPLSYFIIVGIYSSTISTSESSELHRSNQEVYHKGIRAA